MSESGRDGGVEGRGVKGAGVEEVRRLTTGLESVGAKGQDIGGEAGFEEDGFVGSDRSSHC